MSVDTLRIYADIRLGDFTLDVSEEIMLEGVTAVFGPSGSGKSTLLRLVAGLECPNEGFISFRDEPWYDMGLRTFLPAHKRSVGYVFQGGRLFSHLSVAGNLQYADKRSKTDNPAYGLTDVTEAFDLAALLKRRPDTLSGGERQRVALAQALLTRPELLLLDEPLSALDAKRKAEILPYLEQLQTRFGIPILYVSHDVSDVTRIADRVLAIDAGRVVAHGPAVDVLNAHGFETSGAATSGVILVGEVARIDTRLQLTEVTAGENTIRLPMDKTKPVGSTVRVIINASDVALSTRAPKGLSIQNAMRGVIGAITRDDASAMADIMVRLGEATLPVRVTRAAIEALELREGLEVFALVKTAVLAR